MEERVNIRQAVEKYADLEERERLLHDPIALQKALSEAGKVSLMDRLRMKGIEIDTE